MMPPVEGSMLHKGRSASRTESFTLEPKKLHQSRGLQGFVPTPSLKLEPRLGTLQLTNLGGAPLRYAVRSSCCFFVVRSEEQDAIPPTQPASEPEEAKDTSREGLTHSITVVPNERAIQSNLAFLAKVRVSAISNARAQSANKPI